MQNLVRSNAALPRRGGFLKRAVAVATGAAASALAFTASATSTLSSGFSTEVAAQKPELLVIGGIVLGVCAIAFIIAKARRTSGG